MGGCNCVDLEVVCVRAKEPQTSPPVADFGTNLVTTVDHYGKMTAKPRAKHSKWAVRSTTQHQY